MSTSKRWLHGMWCIGGRIWSTISFSWSEQLSEKPELDGVWTMDCKDLASIGQSGGGGGGERDNIVQCKVK